MADAGAVTTEEMLGLTVRVAAVKDILMPTCSCKKSEKPEGQNLTHLGIMACQGWDTTDHTVSEASQPLPWILPVLTASPNLFRVARVSKSRQRHESSYGEF